MVLFLYGQTLKTNIKVNGLMYFVPFNSNLTPNLFHILIAQLNQTWTAWPPGSGPGLQPGL